MLFALGLVVLSFFWMPGFQAPHGGTIPPYILVTNLRPDLFLIDETASIAIVFVWDNNIDRNHSYKEDKYLPLVADLSRTFKTYQFSVEVSARGQVTKANRARLKSFAPRDVTRLLIKNCSKASLLC